MKGRGNMNGVDKLDKSASGQKVAYFHARQHMEVYCNIYVAFPVPIDITIIMTD